MIKPVYPVLMDIVFVRTFLAAASTGSFAGAALRVNASASSVTDRIQTLEHRLGVRLFERSKRGCTLTSAGRRFMAPAQDIVRGWEDGLQDVALPSRFTASINLGGQYALWPGLLMPWLSNVRKDRPNLAIRATAASPARLNWELAEGGIDMAFLYSPVFRKDVMSEELFPDELILVTSAPDVAWQDNYVRIHWSASVDSEIASRLGGVSGAGLIIDLGMQSIDWLISEKASGYLPGRMVTGQIAAGQLHRVAEVPAIHHPAYVCWRRDIDSELGAALILSARQAAALN